MSNRKQVRKEFYPNGTKTGKRALLFNLQVVSDKEYNSMTLSQKILLLAFLEDCKNEVQQWINETKENKPPKP